MGALKCLLLYRLLHVGTFLVSTYFKKKLPNRVYEASNFFLHHVIVITLLRSSTIKVAADHHIRRAIVFYDRPYYKASIDLKAGLITTRLIFVILFSGWTFRSSHEKNIQYDMTIDHHENPSSEFFH